MKTLNTLVLMTSFVTASLITNHAPAQEIGDSVAARTSPGDADGDGHLSSNDIKTMLDILFGGHSATVSRRDLDRNGDGTFDIADVDALRQALEEIEDGSRAGSTTVRVILGDANDDGRVDIADFVAFGLYYTRGHRPAAPGEALDLNRDGQFNIADLVMLGEALGS